MDLNSASARLNQYETGKHSPDFGMLNRLAVVLNVPVEYFYTRDDEIAKLLKNLYLMDADKKEAALKNLM